REMEMVFAMYGPRRRIPGHPGHRDHNGFLNPSRPPKMSAEHGCQHHSNQINEVLLALDSKRMARLHNLGHRTMGFNFFFGENELIVDVEQNQQPADDQGPVRK